MKKIVYAVTVLLGIITISSNFLLDTNLIERKTVKAGGTACRWINESGYGVGPVYYDSTSASGPRGRSKLVSGVKLFECNTSNVSVNKKYDGQKIYDNSGDLLTATIYGNSGTCQSNSYVQITSGILTKSYEPTSYTPSTDSCSGWQTNNLNEKFIVDPLYEIAGTDKKLSEYGIDVGDYVCVCAEY